MSSALRRVQVLDRRLADQIAAGEVVERPASVLKELVENSLDAGAGRIRVELAGSGIELLQVEDDGCGIVAEDLALALSRHATSKIRSLPELLAIGSFGFRGEALPAIASVSRLEILSRSAESTSARRLQVEGGRILNDQPAARAPGTTVRVADLFYNVPARRKFLKSPGTELGRIQKVWRQLALSHFSVAWHLEHGGRVLSRYPVASSQAERDARIAAIVGAEFVANALYFEQEHAPYRLWGWLGLPTYNRSRADEQYLFVNGRTVRDTGLAWALRAAYGDVLYQDRQPVAVLFLELPPDAVDVNVHPAKTELRFRDGREVTDFFRHTLAHILADASRPSIVTAEPSAPPAAVSTPPTGFPPTRPYANARLPLGQVQERGGDAYWERMIPLAQRAADDSNGITPPAMAASSLAEPLSALDTEDFPLGFALGQVHQRFIVAQNTQGLILVDQHAAHERILYERFKAERSPLSCQSLTLPIAVSLSPAQMERLEARAALLREAGLDWSQTGPQSLSLHGGPANLPQGQWSSLVEDCLAAESPWQPGEEDERLASLACRAAIKDQQAMTLADMNALLRQLENTPRYSQCNHGRPTVLQFSLAELDRLFLRGR